MTKIITRKIKANNRHWKNFVDKDYLGSHNLEQGEEMLLTIAKFIGEEEITGADGKKQTKPVLYFSEDVAKMILNNTNAGTISSLYGTHPDKWIGRQIQLYATPVKAFGKTTDALRVRDFAPKRDVNVSEFRAKLESAKNLEELKTIFSELPQAVKQVEEIIKIKDELKAKLK
jgi:hypothetical protein